MNKFGFVGAFLAVGTLFATAQEAQKPPHEQYLVTENQWTGAFPELPDENKPVIYLGTAPDWTMRNAVKVGVVLRTLFPEVEIVMSPVWFPEPGTAELLRRLEEIGVYYQQQHAPPGDTPNLRALAPMPRNYRGEEYPGGNAVLATAPAHQEYLASKLYNGAKYGNNNFKAVDFVWPWEGRWGYDERSVAAFRDDLKGLDEGLLLTDRDGQHRRMMFWDYFEEYHGRRFQPADLGLNDWNDYQPTTESAAAQPDATVETKRNLGVFLALYHYEHLRQNQRFGRAAQAVGGIHQATYNPEDFANGGDYVTLLALADCGTPFIEYFGSPVNTEGAYYHQLTYRRAADAAGKRVGAIFELGQGGHGIPCVTPRTQFVQAFDVTAAGFDQYHNEWINDDYEQLVNPENDYAHSRWRTFLAGAFGYELARFLQAEHRTPPVLSLTLRSVNHYMDAWNWDIKSMDSFCRYFSPLHIDAEESFPGQLAQRLDAVEFLFYTVPYSRARDFAQVSRWLDSGAKTLVTHSYVPYSIDPGYDPLLNASRMAQAPLPDGIKALMKFEVADTVIYRGENYSYADFLSEQIDLPAAEPRLAPEFAALTMPTTAAAGTPAWRGEPLGAEVAAAQYWSWAPEGAEVLATIGDRPLVTLLERPDRSRIVYCHVRLQLLPETLRQTLTAKITAHLELPRVAWPVAERPALAHVYGFDQDRLAAVLWDRAALEERGYYAGYRTASEWSEAQRYTYHCPGADAAVRLQLPATGTYRILALPSGIETVVEADADATVLLELKDRLCELFLVGADTPEWQTRLALIRAKQHQVPQEIGEE